MLSTARAKRSSACFTTTRIGRPSSTWPTKTRRLQSFLPPCWTPEPTSARVSIVLSTNHQRFGQFWIWVPGLSFASFSISDSCRLHYSRAEDIFAAASLDFLPWPRHQGLGLTRSRFAEQLQQFEPSMPGPGLQTHGEASRSHCCGICGAAEATQQTQSRSAWTRSGVLATLAATAQLSASRSSPRRSWRTTSFSGRRATAKN